MENPRPPSIPYPRDKEKRLAIIRTNNDYVRRRIYALEDDQARQLKRLLEQSRDKMSAELLNVINRNGGAWAFDDRYSARTAALMQQITQGLDSLTQNAQTSTLNAMEKSYRGGYYGSAWVIDDALRGSSVVNLPLLPGAAIRAALLSPYGGNTFLDRYQDARADFVKAIRQSMVQSQINGDSIPDAMKRLAAALGVNVGRNGQERGLRARLEMIARTEILRSSNLGTRAIYEANQDVLKGWEFEATNDERTCDECGPLDGKQFAFDDPQEQPPLHPNCRCTLVPALIDTALENKIVGPHQTWSEWKEKRMVFDTGALN